MINMIKKKDLKRAVSGALTAALIAGSVFNVSAGSYYVGEGSAEAATKFIITAETAPDFKDGVCVTDYESLSKAVNSGEKKVYILNDIEMGDILILQGGQTIEGVPDAETGKLPVLNFENMKGATDYVNATSNDGDVGIRIRTSGNTVKNLVIEKAHDNGIQLKGEEATNNTIENCIVRYNNDSGIQIAGGAAGNTLIGVYSYRNCDVFTLGGNADGFAIKLGAGVKTTEDAAAIEAGKITITNCCSWENSDDGWDSFDKDDIDFWTYRLDYTNCIAWNNGTAENVLGYTDYVKGLPLDEGLPMMMRFKAVNRRGYNELVKLYNKGALCSRNASPETYYLRLDSLIGKIPTKSGELKPSGIAENWAGNPNGFKLGSKFTKSNSERRMKGCICFDHQKYGFDRNNSFAKLWAVGCISFDNLENYKLSKDKTSYEIYEWNNILGWNGGQADERPITESGAYAEVINPEKSAASIEKDIRNAADDIAANAKNDIILISDIFERVFPE